LPERTGGRIEDKARQLVKEAALLPAPPVAPSSAPPPNNADNPATNGDNGDAEDETKPGAVA
jgi:hypothetical protein